MNKPRTLKRLLVAGLAIILAWQAQGRVADPLSSDGWILYGIAIVLFVAAMYQARRPEPRPDGPKRHDGPPESLIYRQAFLLCLALLLGLAGFILFANPASQPAAWWLHAASLVVFIAAVVFKKPWTATDAAATADTPPASAPPRSRAARSRARQQLNRCFAYGPQELQRGQRYIRP